jgi:hypothetical protein
VTPMFAQVAGVSPDRLTVAAAMSARMLRLQGLGGTLAFGKAALSVGKQGKQSVQRLVDSAQRGDADALKMLGGKAITGLTKVIAAGDAVTASGTVDGAHAVLFAYLDRKNHSVSECRVYVGGA